MVRKGKSPRVQGESGSIKLVRKVRGKSIPWALFRDFADQAFSRAYAKYFLQGMIEDGNKSERGAYVYTCQKNAGHPRNGCTFMVKVKKDGHLYCIGTCPCQPVLSNEPNTQWEMQRVRSAGLTYPHAYEVAEARFLGPAPSTTPFLGAVDVMAATPMHDPSAAAAVEAAPSQSHVPPPAPFAVLPSVYDFPCRFGFLEDHSSRHSVGSVATTVQSISPESVVDSIVDDADYRATMQPISPSRVRHGRKCYGVECGCDDGGEGGCDDREDLDLSADISISKLNLSDSLEDAALLPCIRDKSWKAGPPILEPSLHFFSDHESDDDLVLTDHPHADADANANALITSSATVDIDLLSDIYFDSIGGPLAVPPAKRARGPLRPFASIFEHHLNQGAATIASSSEGEGELGGL